MPWSSQWMINAAAEILNWLLPLSLPLSKDETISHQRHITIYWTTSTGSYRKDIHQWTSNKRTYALLGSKGQKTKAYAKRRWKKKATYTREEFNDHGEESEPDLYRLPSCHFQLEAFGRDHGRGRPSCGRLFWGLDSSSYQGTYFSSSYHDHPDLFPCLCPCPYHLSQIVDEGSGNVRDRGQSDEKAVLEVEYACRSAKPRRADSWPTRNIFSFNKRYMTKLIFITWILKRDPSKYLPCLKTNSTKEIWEHSQKQKKRHTSRNKRLQHHVCFGIPQMHNYVSKDFCWANVFSSVIEKARQGYLYIYRTMTRSTHAMGSIDRVKSKSTGCTHRRTTEISKKRWHEDVRQAGSIRPRPLVSTSTSAIPRQKKTKELKLPGITYGLWLAWGLRGAGTSQRTNWPNLNYFKYHKLLFLVSHFDTPTEILTFRIRTRDREHELPGEIRWRKECEPWVDRHNERFKFV